MTLKIPVRTLADGTSIPVLGFGTYRLTGAAGVTAMLSAIHEGYRHLDSAVNYENEDALGTAVRTSGVPREQFRLASKLPGRHHAYDDALASVHESLQRAGLEYWDLFLIHWPNPRVDKYVEAFQALVDLQAKGLIRSVGVSNFLPGHINRLEEEVGVLPSVNQIEVHPFFTQKEALAFHSKKGIVTEGWSPIGRGTTIRKHPLIRTIAENVRRSPAQVILRWHLQRGIVPLPKSASPARQRENRAVFDFELTDEQMNEVTDLARPDGRLFGLDPAFHEEM